jgi:hypothetical protein
MTTSLTVAKAGKTSLVNGTPGAGEVSGRHNFPAHVNRGGIAAYYKLVLHNAGWVDGTDYSVSGGAIHFFGISTLDGGASNKEVAVEGSMDSKDVPWTEIPKVQHVRIERDGPGQDGSITLVAFGVDLEIPAETISTSTSPVIVDFLATDSAGGILIKIRDALVADGWIAAINDGVLTIQKNGHGDSIYSLWHSVAYTGEGSNEDHWIFLDDDD